MRVILNKGGPVCVGGVIIWGMIYMRFESPLFYFEKKYHTMKSHLERFQMAFIPCIPAAFQAWSGKYQIQVAFILEGKQKILS